MQAWYAKEINPTGKRSLVWNPKAALQPDDPIEIACGQCIGCKLERSKQWAIRCMHEAQMHEKNSFITLTFDQESLQKRSNPWSLDHREFQLFMKKLRKEYVPKCPYKTGTDEHKDWMRDNGVRYFHCGEYGEVCRYCMNSKKFCKCGPIEEWNERKRPGRPHYHACLFNFDFEDKYLFKISNAGEKYYRSPTLEKLWPYGQSMIGDVTFESAAYVARYITKKVNGEAAEDHYRQLDYETGEIYDIKPEYITMSRRPGIGKWWYEKYKEDVYPKDFVTVRGKKMNPPRFYDRILEQEDVYRYEEIKEKRVEKGKKYNDNNTRERLDVREKVKQLQIRKLKRNIEDV